MVTSLGFTQLAQPASNPPPAAVTRGGGDPLLARYVNIQSNSVRVYSRTGAVWSWVKTSTPTVTVPQGCQMSPDGNYVATGPNSGGAHRIMKVASDGTVTNCTLTGTAITSVSYGVSWHPSSNYVAIAIGGGGSPTAVLAIFKKVDADTWNCFATLTKGGAGTGVSWNKDGTRLVGHGNSSPFLEVWNFNSSTDTFTAVSGTPIDSQPASNIMRGFAHNPIDDTLVCLRSTGGPGFAYYAYEASANSGNGQYQKKTDLSDGTQVQSNYGSMPAWTPDGLHLIVPLSASPWVRAYDYDLSTKTLTVGANQITDFSAATYDCIFDNTNNLVVVGTGAKFYTTRTLGNIAYDWPAFGFAALLSALPPIDATIAYAWPAPVMAAVAKQTNHLTAAYDWPVPIMSSIVSYPIDATIAYSWPSFDMIAIGSQPEPIDATIAYAWPSFNFDLEEWFYLSVGGSMPWPAFGFAATLYQPGPIDAEVAIVWPSFDMDTLLFQNLQQLTVAMDWPPFEVDAEVFVTLPPISADIAIIWPAFKTSTRLGYEAPEGAEDLAGIRASIKEKGRPLVFWKRDEQLDIADPLGPPVAMETSVDSYCVNVYPSGLIHLGLNKQRREQFDKADKIIMVAPPESGEELNVYSYVIDDGQRWEIVSSETLKPGLVTLLYYFGIRRG